MNFLRSIIFFTLLAGFIGAYLSITLYQGFFILAILGGLLYLILKLRGNGFKILSPKEKLFYIPILGHISTITLSSVLFLRVKEQWRRLIEQDFFSFSYFLAFTQTEENLKKLLVWFAYLSIPLGWAVSLKLFYSYFVHHDIKAFWGGKFIIGNLLVISVFSALYLIYSDRNIWIRILSALSVPVFVEAIILSEARSVFFAFVLTIPVFILGTVKVIRSRWYKFIAVELLILGLLSLVIYLPQDRRVKWWKAELNKHGLTVQVLDALSSKRITIAKGAVELIQRAINERDYIKLLIGWGYGPQKQYKNLPGWFKTHLNEYESFVFLTEFINGGFLNLIFIVWFYISAVILTRRVFKNLKTREDLLKLSFMSAVWVNLLYHLFTLFWVPINALYYLILGILEILSKRTEKKV